MNERRARRRAHFRFRSGNLLNSYSGRYRLAPGVTVTVSNGATGRLTASFNFMSAIPSAIPLVAEGENEFATPDSAATFEFHRNGQGVITSLQINTYGQETSAPKLP